MDYGTCILIIFICDTVYGKTFEGGNFYGCKQNSLFTGKNLAFQI